MCVFSVFSGDFSLLGCSGCCWSCCYLFMFVLLYAYAYACGCVWFCMCECDLVFFYLVLEHAEIMMFTFHVRFCCDGFAFSHERFCLFICICVCVCVLNAFHYKTQSIKVQLISLSCYFSLSPTFGKIAISICFGFGIFGL